MCVCVFGGGAFECQLYYFLAFYIEIVFQF